ncbi:PP2C family protein-serine/threonine phosphatase [Vallitalea sp.]|uniref:PP2C family protein-serine/threonine phosphatase n=1 Tax=Vallitalea sp. TaxID=1882829 RepID=UPI0025D7EA3A|nr:protein phosphatase 2C domain-containing protein [Vallitalea sp.]MCT4688709.1 protein phosphatase 2C domain-containing protein [Vallitalea sp.]
MTKKKFEYGIISECGLVKKVNQDRILIKIGQINSMEFGLFVIADGMGGHLLGEVASTIAICELTNWWDSSLEKIMMESNNIFLAVKTSLLDCFKNINRTIYDSKDKDKKMGTTLTVLFVYGDKYVITHIGDSRIYIKDTNSLEQISKDHSLVAAGLRQGQLSIDSLYFNTNKNILTQCIGLKKNINPFTKIDYTDKMSIFMLCSDGVYNFIAKEVMDKIVIKQLKNNVSLQSIVNDIYNIVLKNGAGDNASIILVNYKKYFWRK